MKIAMDGMTTALLRELLPGFTPVPQAIEDKSSKTVGNVIGEKLLLPSAVGADYSFELLEYHDGERHIAAQRVSAAESEYFWYLPFEYGSPEVIQNSYLQTARTLLTHNTRIVQKSGLLFVTFRCYYQNGSKWKRLAGVSAFRSSFNFPKIEGRNRLYASPPLVPS